MNPTEPQRAAAPSDIRGTSIGYAINLIMDYGSGRQVTISGTLPLGASLEEMNKELDKLRLATNRQSSLVSLRDVLNTVAMAKKTKASFKLMIEAYNAEIEKEMDGLKRDVNLTSMKKQQIENLRAQALNNRITKGEEIMRAQADIEKAHRLLGYEPTVSFEEGLRRTVEWYKGSIVEPLGSSG